MGAGPHELGLTLPRLRDLSEARGRRYAVVLRDQALAMAVAYHKPKLIEQVIKVPKRASERAIESEQFVNETWWRVKEG